MVIARHAIVDVTRRRIVTHELTREPRDPDRTPDESVDLWSDLEVLNEALDQLTEEQRNVIELQLAGLSGPAIAAALGKSHDAVKMLRLRAVRRLRDVLILDTEQHDD